MRYVNWLLDGPSTSESWHSPSESIEVQRDLGQLRTLLRKREKFLLRQCLEGNSESNNEELTDIALVLHEAWRRYLELVFGGRIKWRLVEQLKPLNPKSSRYFEVFFKERCNEQRRNLIDWLEYGPILGRNNGDKWQRCPEVWTLLRMIGVTTLNPATVAAIYLHLFKQFPSFPDIEPDKSLSDKENSIQAKKAKPIYAIWELQEIAKALGYRG